MAGTEVSGEERKLRARKRGEECVRGGFHAAGVTSTHLAALLYMARARRWFLRVVRGTREVARAFVREPYVRYVRE